MSRKKNVVVKSTHKGKRWVLDISGNDREARKAIVKAILQLPAKGIEILNGADPFGVEPEPRQSKHRIIHGKNCPKVSHSGRQGLLHGADDDQPYDIDGVAYCGRCHHALPVAEPPQDPLRQQQDGQPKTQADMLRGLGAL